MFTNAMLRVGMCVRACVRLCVCARDTAVDVEAICMKRMCIDMQTVAKALGV